jgi:hypothetical protein
MNKPTKVIVSAALPELSPKENSRRTSELVCDLSLLEGVEHIREAMGFSDGFHAPCAVCWLNPGFILETTDAIRDAAKGYSQERILVVHSDDAVELVEVDTECSAILGTFTAVRKPRFGEDHTMIDGRFWVAR